MIKRAIIQPPAMLRISKPGIDVDSATQAQLILDERVLYSQIYLAGYVAKAGSTTDYVINYPTLGYAPICLVFNKFTDGKVVFPSRYKYQVGGTSFLYPSTHYRSQAGTLTVSLQSAAEIEGVYYLILRSKM